ncbi:MAG: ferredoxin [Candidatus Tectimicrobiota bacterium]|nr:MAG: ferredoxin [Candidatus Tectomicrobia bacterium]
MAKTRGTIVIEPERCKGCDICVAFCPPQVLRLSRRRNSLNHRVVELFDPAGCTGCEICARVCPDLAIVAVYRERVHA